MPESPQLELVCDRGPARPHRHRPLRFLASVPLAVILAMAAALSGCGPAATQADARTWSDATCDYLREQSEAQVAVCREFCTNEPDACNEGKACPVSDIRRWKEARPYCPKAIYYPAPTWPPTNLLVE